MASVSRSALFAKMQKVLKKHYKPVAPPEERTVLEHLLFASCLEDARYEAAEEAFGALGEAFFDRNEVRVASISELAEVMSVLPDPRAAANRIKRILHGIFEELYSFDLEDKRKKNLGPTVKWLEKSEGTSRFSVAYVVQAALGGHAIPVDAGTMSVFRVLDLVTEKEAIGGEVPGMDRAVSKSKGIEFGSLIHQLGADYLANPFSPQIREIVLAIDSDAAKRFPQRRQPRVEPLAAPRPSTETAAASTSSRKNKGAPAAKSSPETKSPDGKHPDGKHPDGKHPENKPPEDRIADGKKPASKKAAEAPSHGASHSTTSHGAGPAKPDKSEKHSKTDKPEKRTGDPSRSQPAAEGIGKRKPR